MLPFFFIPNKNLLFLLYNMIQGFTETNINAELSTEDNRIDTTVPSAQIRFLVKFINDLDGSIAYVYPTSVIYNRYTSMSFVYEATLASVDFYSAEIHLLPAGHWKYEVYEVSWSGAAVGVEYLLAPATETDVILPPSNRVGVVQGIVTKGILNLTEKAGTEQVQYNQHQSPDTANYVWYGTDIDVWNPADEASMIAFYRNKTGLSLVDNKVYKWDDSSSNNFDMSQSTVANRPSYTESTGGLIFSDASDFLSSSAAFTLNLEFTIAFKIKATTFTGRILSDTASPMPVIELITNKTLNIDTVLDVSNTLTTATADWQDAYVVLTRNASHIINLYVNGLLQASAVTQEGDYRFDIIGTDNLGLNNFDGSIFEIQVYNSTSPTLTDNINERLSNL